MMDPIPEQVVWFYGEGQPMYETLPDIEFIEGLPSGKVLEGMKKNPGDSR